MTIVNTLEKKVNLLIDYIASTRVEDKEVLLSELLYLKESSAEKPVKTVVEDLLVKCGIPIHNLGYDYLVTSVIILLEHPEYKGAITKLLYSAVAKIYDSNIPRVERCIRIAIHNGFNRLNPIVREEMLGYAFNSPDDIPTNTEFICRVAQIVQRMGGVKE